MAFSCFSLFGTTTGEHGCVLLIICSTKPWAWDSARHLRPSHKALTVGWMDGWVDGWMQGVDRGMEDGEWIDGWLGGWVDTDQYMNGLWMHGWMNSGFMPQ